MTLEIIADIADIISALVLGGGALFLYRKSREQTQEQPMSIEGDDNKVTVLNINSKRVFDAGISTSESGEDDILKKYYEEK